MISSRKLEDLAPHVRVKAEMFERECAKEGIDIIFTSTFRDIESQDALYAQGRTKPGKIVTNAKGGYSFHNFRLAFDFAPVVNGKVPWNDTALFKRCGAIAKRCGLEWAGDWKKFKELAHCQDSGGMTLEQLRNGAAHPYPSE